MHIIDGYIKYILYIKTHITLYIKYASFIKTLYVIIHKDPYNVIH